MQWPQEATLDVNAAHAKRFHAAGFSEGATALMKGCELTNRMLTVSAGVPDLLSLLVVSPRQASQKTKACSFVHQWRDLELACSSCDERLLRLSMPATSSVALDEEDRNWATGKTVSLSRTERSTPGSR
jgi:hypothetical protein